MPQLPTPVSEDINIVLVGSLNPAIFHPEWFLRQGLVSSDEAKSAEVNVVSPQLADMKFWDFGFQVVPNRLTVRTINISSAPKISDFVVGVLTHLPHTPISAAGINQLIHLPIGNEQDWHKIGNYLAPKDPVWSDLYTNPGMMAVSIQAQRSGRFPGSINVTVQPSLAVVNGIFVSSNFDFKAPNEHASATSIIEFLVAEWSQAVKEATRVADCIFRKILWEQPQ